MSIAKVSVFIIITLAVIGGAMYINKVIEHNIAMQEQQKIEDAKNARDEVLGKLVKEDVKVGDGPEVKKGDSVTVHYTLSLEDGTKIESSRDRGEPFTFVLGDGSVIEGWELGLVGMRGGGVRNLTIPPELAYGPQENGPIPANSTLKFNIEMLGVIQQIQ